MIPVTIFISYARADVQAAAARLRGELAAMGFHVRRDAEEMRGGRDWKEPLRAALRTVDALEANARPALLPDSALAGSVQDVARIVGDPAVAVKHRLKLALPIVPLLLSYEGEIERDNRASLLQGWRAMVQWIQRRQP